jgi:hypothetical protein
LEKHSESRLSYLFAHLPLLSSDLFSSDSFHLCFSTVHIVGSFTSKLSSIIILSINWYNLFINCNSFEGHAQSSPRAILWAKWCFMDRRSNCSGVLHVLSMFWCISIPPSRSQACAKSKIDPNGVKQKLQSCTETMKRLEEAAASNGYQFPITLQRTLGRLVEVAEKCNFWNK